MCFGWCLHFVQLRDHEVVEGVCVPRCHECREDPSEDAHKTSKLSEKVEEIIPAARIFKTIQIHLNHEPHPLLSHLLQGKSSRRLQVEQMFVWMLSPFVKIRVPSILLGSMCRLDFEAMHVFILAANRQVLQAFFMNLCLFKEVSWVEASLIVNYDDIFSTKPLTYFIS